ncbi:MAG: hypothetical protein V3T65_09200, partial [Acidobacteriota bacterium]
PSSGKLMRLILSSLDKSAAALHAPRGDIIHRRGCSLDGLDGWNAWMNWLVALLVELPDGRAFLPETKGRRLPV